MKRRIDDEDPTADEIEVAEILVDLPQRILESESRRRLPPWGSKRRRSIPRIESAPPSPQPPINPSPPPRPPPSLPGNVLVFAPKTKSEAPSPASPLTFFPSEHEENTKLKTPKKKSTYKMKREERLHLINELTQRKELMYKEIENVRAYYEKLKAYNLALKSRRDELIGVIDVNRPTAGYHHGQIPPPFNQQAISVGLAAEILNGSDKSGVVWDGGRDNVGPVGMFDLNVELAWSKPCEPLDRYSYRDYKDRTAQNRLNRKRIRETKKINRYR